MLEDKPDVDSVLMVAMDALQELREIKIAVGRDGAKADLEPVVRALENRLGALMRTPTYPAARNPYGDLVGQLAWAQGHRVGWSVGYQDCTRVHEPVVRMLMQITGPRRPDPGHLSVSAGVILRAMDVLDEFGVKASLVKKGEP